jgi:hypothetical protein
VIEKERERERNKRGRLEIKQCHTDFRRVPWCSIRSVTRAVDDCLLLLLDRASKHLFFYILV